MIINKNYCRNTAEELQALLVDANSSYDARHIESDELMTLMHGLETQVLQFKGQGGDVRVLARVCERLQALSSQLVTR
jgi:hypothetical protein